MSSGPERGRRLPPVVRQLGVVSFFNDFASEMVYPLLPALVTGRLGGTAFALGALDGVAECVAALTKLASGRIADRPGRRRPLVVAGYVLATAARPLMALAGSVWQVVALRGSDRLGKGIRNPPRDAVIADATPAELRGRAFGYHRAMDHGGAVLGPLVAWMLLSAGMQPEGVIAWSVVPGIVAVGVVAWALRRYGGTPRHPSEESVRRTRDRSRLVFGLIVVFACARMPETLLLLRMQDLGVPVPVIPVLWAGLHIVRSAGSYPGGWLSDRIGPRRTMIVGWCTYVLICAGLAWSTTTIAAVGWFMVFGLVAAMTEGPERAFVAATGAARRQGTGFGIYHAAVGIAALPGALALGTLYTRAGGAIALVCSGAATLFLAVVAAGARANADGPRVAAP